MPLEIDGRIIGPSMPPYIIAEISGNHDGRIERALSLIDAAADAGCDAVKFQTYTADGMTMPSRAPGFVIDDDASIWKGETLHSLYQRAQTPYEWHADLFQHAKGHGLTAFSSVFDTSGLALLKSLNVPCYKISSFEIVDIPLIKEVAKVGKPMIISTGMATLNEIRVAVEAARSQGLTDIALLKCTSSYPASPGSAHLKTIPFLREQFSVEVGLSDHTLGIGVAVASVVLGGTIIEKHLTLDSGDGAVDSTFSVNPTELQQLVLQSRAAFEANDGPALGPSKDEITSLKYRRSLYFVESLEPNQLVTSSSIRSIRPGYGLSPALLPTLIGMRVTRAVTAGDPVRADDFEDKTPFAYLADADSGASS